MSAITSATYTINYKRRLGDSKVINNVSIVFGNGTLTYATGGFALSGGSMGCPNNIESVIVLSNTNSGYVPRWDQATGNMLVFEVAAIATGTGGAVAAPLVEANTAALAAQTVVCDVIGW
jgi:hypothetical protein